MNANAYLDRIGLTARDAEQTEPDEETLKAVLSAHVRRVPFENLAIVGDPHGDAEGEGVSLHLPDLYEKIVERERGGFCFEVNGLFNRLLTTLGFEADRCAARVGGDEETLGRPPANHHTNVVHLDRRYVVDAGTGGPQAREPVPLDGTVIEDSAGVRWRIDASEMALSDYELWLCEPGGEWDRKYRFQTEPRELSFFEATCEFLSNEPDGTFTRGPFVQRSTAEGYLRLGADTLTRTVGTAQTETDIPPEDWHDTLAEEFGIRL
jgi:N-hydroxyarylamine O-acetyltransferase